MNKNREVRVAGPAPKRESVFNTPQKTETPGFQEPDFVGKRPDLLVSSTSETARTASDRETVRQVVKSHLVGWFKKQFEAQTPLDPLGRLIW